MNLRPALAFVMLASAAPAQAWEFTPGLPCRLHHTEGDIDVTLTFDPTQPLYSVTVTQPQPWPEADVFAMRFDGPAPLAIGTDRHQLDPTGRSVTVTDTGFGNVLNGLQFNDAATATLGDRSVSVSLEGAAEPVAAFRACEVEAGA